MADIGKLAALLAGCWHQNEAKAQSGAEEDASGRIIRIARAISSTRDAQEKQRPGLRVSCYERF
jgi:hypothetical protein